MLDIALCSPLSHQTAHSIAQAVPSPQSMHTRSVPTLPYYDIHILPLRAEQAYALLLARDLERIAHAVRLLTVIVCKLCPERIHAQLQLVELGRERDYC